MFLTQSALEAIATALWLTHPEVLPLEVPPDALSLWVTTLPEWRARAEAPDEEELRAIRFLWYEHAQAEEADVSG